MDCSKERTFGNFLQSTLYGCFKDALLCDICLLIDVSFSVLEHFDTLFSSGLRDHIQKLYGQRVASVRDVREDQR